MRIVRAGCACLMTFLVAGCAALPPVVERPPTFAITDTTTPLAVLGTRGAPDPDASGFRLLPMPPYSMHARLELARRAERTIDVQYYLLRDDGTGRQLLRGLRDAAERGVRVRVLIDDLYTGGSDPLLLAFASHPNVQVRLFNPFPAGRARLASRIAASLLDFDRIHRRMHNKLYVADNALAIVGGRNIGDEYFLRDAGSNFIDIDTLVGGAVVPRLSSLFDMYWNSPYVYPIASLASVAATPAELQSRFEQMTAPSLPRADEVPFGNDLLGYRPIGADIDDGDLALTWAPAEAYADAPDKALGAVAHRPKVAAESPDGVLFNLRRLVRSAEFEVLETTPYLIPGHGGMTSIRMLRARGVRFAIVTNSLAATDESLVHMAYRRYRPELLQLGVELYELSPQGVDRARRFGLAGSASGRLHGKSAVVDEKAVFIGSLNFDPRSDLHNTELGLFVFSPQIAAQLKKLIGFITMDAAYRLRWTDRGIEWIAVGEDGGEVVRREEPETTLGSRLKLDLLAPLVPESLL